ncbi:MAG: rod shape-determining protein MreC [Elusimicrobiota bacterium]|jgi:rod shape-determining protein MreC|nr:rod shape-determining protein MreC [Elusimicrobiota bacterium]
MLKDKHHNKKKKSDGYDSVLRILPLLFSVLSLFLIILPLQKPINSFRAVLSYIFVPQLRAVHAAVQYLDGVSESVGVLLNAAVENYALKDEISKLKIQNAQNEVLQLENERLNNALKMSQQIKWQGAWARIIYREPSRLNTVIIDKGTDHGIVLRSPVIGVEEGVVGLIGKVIEVSLKTSKIVLSSDEEFCITAFLAESRVEGLACGNDRGGMFVKYLSLETPANEKEKVYTSVSSAIFPEGILIGEIGSSERISVTTDAFLTLPLKPAVNPMRTKELFVLISSSNTDKVLNEGKK